MNDIEHFMNGDWNVVRVVSGLMHDEKHCDADFKRESSPRWSPAEPERPRRPPLTKFVQFAFSKVWAPLIATFDVIQRSLHALNTRILCAFPKGVKVPKKKEVLLGYQERVSPKRTRKKWEKVTVLRFKHTSWAKERMWPKKRFVLGRSSLSTRISSFRHWWDTTQSSGRQGKTISFVSETQQVGKYSMWKPQAIVGYWLCDYVKQMLRGCERNALGKKSGLFTWSSDTCTLSEESDDNNKNNTAYYFKTSRIFHVMYGEGARATLSSTKLHVTRFRQVFFARKRWAAKPRADSQTFMFISCTHTSREPILECWSGL